MWNLRDILHFVSVSENITANVELGHILFAPNEEPLVYGPWQEISQPYHRNSSNYRMDNPSYDHLNHYSGLNECGIISYYTDDTNRLISDGEESLPGQWPWLVAIYKQDNEEYSFRCAGTILTTRHVITQKGCIVHSIESSIKLLEPQRLWVLFGQLNPRNWNGNHTGIINRVVVYYTFFPSGPLYDYWHTGLTILHLKTTVEYNAFIRPICLWSGTTNLQDTVNMTGYVVGWGKDQIGPFPKPSQPYGDPLQYTEVPRMEKVPLLNVTVNTYKENEFHYLHPVHPSNICCTDKGGGLMVFNTTMGHYQLRGITISCASDLIWFFDLAKLTSWIQEHIERKLCGIYEKNNNCMVK